MIRQPFKGFFRQPVGNGLACLQYRPQSHWKLVGKPQIKVARMKRTSLEDWRKRVHEEWKMLSHELLQNFVNSMEDRIAAWIAAKGGYTKYWPKSHDIRRHLHIKVSKRRVISAQLLRCRTRWRSQAGHKIPAGAISLLTAISLFTNPRSIKSNWFPSDCTLQFL